MNAGPRPERVIERAEVQPGARLGFPGRSGSVYELGREVFKEYIPEFHEPRPSHISALIAWRHALAENERNFLDLRCAWPRAEVVEHGKTVGFLMPKAPDIFWATVGGERRLLSLQDFCRPDQFLKTPDADWPTRIQTFGQVVEMFGFFEGRKVVYPDLSALNVLWTIVTTPDGREAPRTYFIDCDSVLLADSSPRVVTHGHREWADPRDVVDEDTPRYSLGMLYYRGCLRLPAPTGDVRAPLHAVRPSHARKLVRAALDTTTPRPTATEWLAVLSEQRTPAAKPSRLQPQIVYASSALYLAASALFGILIGLMVLVLLGRVHL